ncbi:MAG: universal stress protein [Bacteroidetes bacterium]|nr:universal stress protein [Bacteroidota bacterium]
MKSDFRKIGLAIAFSPTAEAMLAEAARLASLFSAELVLIHVGKKEEAKELRVNEMIRSVNIAVPYKIIWREGNPDKEILKACREEQIDLLVAGALKKEKALQHYIGSIARAIMRKADCSVYMVNNPSVNPQPIQQIVVNAEDSAHVEFAIATACRMAELEGASWVHIVRELKMLGLTLAANDQCTEEEYNETKQELVQDEVTAVEKILARIPHQKTKINIKMLSGKSGFELCKFVERKQAGLLIVGAPPQRLSLFDRIFPHDLEYVFADLPCNLLVVNQQNETHHG